MMNPPQSESGLRRLPASVIGLILLLQIGCASKGPQPFFSARSLPEFSQDGTAVVSSRWWREFPDAALDRQINLALGQNFDLSTAAQRIRAARAVTRREASDLLPDVNGFLRIDHTGQPGPNRTRSTLGFNAAWQIDLWGQIQSRIDAEQFRADATHADYHAVALSLSAEIARTWFSLIESYAQLALLEEQLATNENGLEAVELRFATGGQGGSPNVLRQRQLVQSTLEQFTIVKADIDVLEHQLAVLTGQPPQNAQYETGGRLPDLPPLPSTGVPCDVLARRPDVRSDYLAFVAADRDLDAAVTDQYPRLNLSGSLQTAAERPEAFLRDWVLSIGGQLIGPILDGGQRRAEVERNRAVRQLRFNQYRQTVLIALQEVEDGLALERYQTQRIEKLEAQLELAQLASDQLRQRFITGDANYLDILSAIQSQQRLQRTILSARLDLILIRIGLYLALAGDFDTRPQFDVQLREVIPELPVEIDFEAVDEAAKAEATK